MSRNFWLAILLSSIFLIIGLATLPGYGINWDTINHLPRGQAYLHYFLTGKRDFSDLPHFFDGYQKPGQWYWQNPSSLSIDTDIPNNTFPRVSLYQKAGVDFNYFVDNDGGHPPISDILSSLFNWVLFQKLGLINDIDSYRVYGIFLSACLVMLVYYWTRKIYGSFAGLVAVISLVTYPLFFSEAHFNTEKDIPEMVYWSFLLFSVWKMVITTNWKWMILAGGFGGLGLGTKFNILFSPLVILPWLSAYLIDLYLKKKLKLVIFLKNNFKLFFYLLLIPILGFSIFILSWPYLWYQGLEGLKTVFGFYKSIGTATSIDSRFYWHFGINLYPIKWVIYTTPLITLALSILGIWAVILNLFKREDKTGLLFILWLIIPIVRVSLPGTNIYGGDRQIMEFIPALAILAGLGGAHLRDFILLQSKKIKYLNFKKDYLFLNLIIILLFTPIIIKLIQIHPNQNAYFNPLIGGLAVAKEKNIPGWGNTFGSAYRQGAVWLNGNTESGAKIAYARELMSNIPRIWLRQDLDFHNSNRSGARREGEYIIGLIYQGTEQTSYFDKYLERFLEPVYRVQVDGVSILKIWKNDLDHTKEEYVDEVEIREYNITKGSSGITFDFGKLITLSRIEWEFNNIGCSEISLAFVRISKDGQKWDRLPGTMPKEDWSVPKLGNQPKENSILIPFAAEKAKYVNVNINPLDACLFNQMNIKVFSLPKVLSFEMLTERFL